MNERFDTESRKALIDYRLQRAVETLKEADYNAAGNYFNTAVNRLYYAAFYAASALMLAHEVECSTHSGIKSMLSLKFVRTGLLDRKHGKRSCNCSRTVRLVIMKILFTVMRNYIPFYDQKPKISSLQLNL